MRQLFVLFLLGMLTACGPATEAETTAETTETPAAEPEPSPTTAPLLITPDAFAGIEPGDPVAEHAAMLEEGLLETGDGEYEVLFINHPEHGQIGHLFTAGDSGELIDMIVITSPEVQTAEGIKTGSTWADLQRAYGPIEVHGSEVESRTYADANGMMFRLDYYESSYEVDESQIPADTEITQLLISR